MMANSSLPSFVVAAARAKHRQLQLVLSQIMDGVFEGYGLALVVVVNHHHRILVIIVGLAPGMRTTPRCLQLAYPIERLQPQRIAQPPLSAVGWNALFGTGLVLKTLTQDAKAILFAIHLRDIRKPPPLLIPECLQQSNAR